MTVQLGKLRQYRLIFRIDDRLGRLGFAVLYELYEGIVQLFLMFRLPVMVNNEITADAEQDGKRRHQRNTNLFSHCHILSETRGGSLCALARFGCHQLIQLRIFREFICERHKGTAHLDKPVSGFHIRNIRHLKVGDI